MAVRKIPKSYLKNLTGAFAHAKGLPPQGFESRLELDVLTVLAFDPRVISFKTQPVHVPVPSELKPYTPDVLVHFSQDPKWGPPLRPWLIEVKYHKDLDKLQDELQPKFEAAQAYAAANDCEFKVLTEREISTPYLKNARFLLSNLAQGPDPRLVGTILDQLNNLGECEVLDLAALDTPEDLRAEKLAAIWWLVATRKVWADLGRKFVCQRVRPKVILRYSETPDSQFYWSEDGPPLAATYFRNLVGNPKMAVQDLESPHQGVLNLSVGSKVACGDRLVVIKELCDDLAHVIVRIDGTNGLDKVPIASLRPRPLVKRNGLITVNPPRPVELALVSGDAYELAQARAAQIAPTLTGRFTVKELDARAIELGVSLATVYRWREKYRASGEVSSSLLPSIPDGGRGKVRLGKVEELLEKYVDFYIRTKPKPSKTQAYEEMVAEIDGMRAAGVEIATPCLNTFRARIAARDPYDVIKGREGYRAAEEATDMDRGCFPHATHPMSVVEMDMTVSDLILLDDETREVLGRAYITHAVDVFSSALVGFDLQVGDKGAYSAGQCVYSAVMPKDEILRELEIDATWPCSGLMDHLHMDNALAYRGNVIGMGMAEYGVNTDFRPVRKPQYGGHVESFHRTLSDAIHALPGTTGRSIKDRGNYDSEANAVITFSEFRQWLVRFFCSYNHKPKSDGLSPVQKFKEGILGSKWHQPHGKLRMPADTARFRLDLLPFVERTIQTYGVDIDNLRYQEPEALAPFMGMTDRKFLFRTDPNDRSVIYFWDPKLKRHVPIPAIDEDELRGLTKAEVRAAKVAKAAHGAATRDNHQISRLSKENRELVVAAAAKTKTGRRQLAKQNQNLKEAEKQAKAVRGLVPSVKARIAIHAANVTPLRTLSDAEQPFEIEETN